MAEHGFAVTALSTIAMVDYPLLFQGIGFSELQQSILISATIHVVAQVVGAGFSVSDAAGEMVTITKLFRGEWTKHGGHLRRCGPF